MRASYGCRVWARTYARASGSGAHRRKLKKLKNPATQECRASLGGPTTDDFHLSVLFRSEAQTLRAHFGFSCRPHTRLTPRSDEEVPSTLAASPVQSHCGAIIPGKPERNPGRWEPLCARAVQSCARYPQGHLGRSRNRYKALTMTTKEDTGHC